MVPDRYLKRKILCCKSLLVAFVVLQHMIKLITLIAVGSHVVTEGEDSVCSKPLLTQ